MEARQQYIDAYHEAMEQERALWAKLHEKQLDKRGFDRALWDRWVDAVKRTNATSKALREAFKEPPHPSGFTALPED